MKIVFEGPLGNRKVDSCNMFYSLRAEERALWASPRNIIHEERLRFRLARKNGFSELQDVLLEYKKLNGKLPINGYFTTEFLPK